MAQLKFINQDVKNTASSCCGPTQSSPGAGDRIFSLPCGCSHGDNNDYNAPWIAGAIDTDAGVIKRISTDLSTADFIEHVRCRVSAFRDNFIVSPGLYAVGMPDKDSDVLVSANYKLSFDSLRKELKGLNVWVLVLDTKGINVWCAAGKGTFGTDELTKRIALTRLDKVVNHRRLIVPQLGAPGINAPSVRKASGFRVCYGPVRAKDIKAYISTGYKATREMRTVTFPLIERLILTPMEINPAMKKYYPWYALALLVIFGLQPEGIFFKDAFTGGLPFLVLGLISVLAGAFFTPVLLPFIPFRSFAIKGLIAGVISIYLVMKVAPSLSQQNNLLAIFTYLFFPFASSYIALQFTGSTTFTGMSGVKKELKIGIPVYFFITAASLVLLAAFKLTQWRVI